MKYILTTITTLLFAFVAPAQKMPDFRFLDTENQARAVQDISKGKALMLVYFRSDCDHCTHTAQQLKTEAAKYPLTIWMVSAETQPALRTFEDMMGLYDIGNLSIMQDYSQSMHKWFEFSALPYIVLFDKNKKQLKTFAELPSVATIKKILAQK